jgi:hypothetical protein
MATKKTADLSASLVAVKGQAVTATDTAEPVSDATSAITPLNFKVDAEFRRRFRQRAAEADLKLNELLREALAAWEEKNGMGS